MDLARKRLADLRIVHGLLTADRLVARIALPWAGGDVVEVAAERDGDRLGIRDFWFLADVRQEDRVAALSLLRSGCVVEAVSVDAPEPPPAPVPPKSKRRAYA